MVVYKILNTVNGKYYIGQTINKYPSIRWAQHRLSLRNNNHENTHLQRAWNKYGESAFEFLIIESASSLEELNTLEEEYILANIGGYNILPGGGNKNLPDTVKDKISKSHQGKKRGPHSDLHGERIGYANSRRVWKESSKEKLRKYRNSFEVSKMLSDSIKKQCSKTYPGVISPNGVIYEQIHNLREFCRKHNLDRGNMFRMLKGKVKTVKGWKLK